MTIRVANRQRRIPLRVETYRTLAEKVLHKLGQPEAEISLSFISDRRIRSLNRIYRGKDQPTDVLAFSLANSKQVKATKNGERSPPLFLGDVVISVPTARRQARERRHGLRREITWLMIHGILHLLDYDHEKTDDARRMQRKERVLLRQLTDNNR
jgi:probable rRNA maturation factor